MTDRDRLNWLANPNHEPYEFIPQMGGGVCVWWAESARGKYFKSLRKAIDWAIKVSDKKASAEGR